MLGYRDLGFGLEDAWGRAAAGGDARGEPADGVVAMDLAREHRHAIDRWVFECSHALHVQITALLVAGPAQLGFLVPPRRQLPVMGRYIRDASAANAARRG
ncbi:TipAS antibiotic-recognition domain-containing protein [Pseudonocardia sp. H11422]|uniref:TipAS antibiotic-recognition domain-containing protein n=1 Tax=Pseudonocardia sp. H11422 TaxID=2835866 RepID=UPI001BDCAC08|nr:TipAS antibiotic-recognition domain-containing protein [Pseudonocardia sp. H11422]